jgi:hypothetical protein
MNRNYVSNSIESQSVWVDVSGTGAIHDHLRGKRKQGVPF